jgi:hypothetical protein
VPFDAAIGFRRPRLRGNDGYGDGNEEKESKRDQLQ